MAIASGICWGLSFAEHSSLLFSLAGLVPLFLLLSVPRAWLWGWIHGAVSWGVAMVWLVGTLTTYGQIQGWLAGLLLLAFALVFGLYTLVFSAIGSRLWKRGGVLALLALPALWVVIEIVRGFLITGFPWNLAAYAWIRMPGALPLAAWIGAWGVSALIVGAHAGLARGVTTKNLPLAVGTVLGTAFLLALGARWGAASGGERGAQASPPQIVRTAALIQPDTPNQIAFDAATFEADYARLLALTDEACRSGSLVLWPESAAWPMIYGRDARLSADLARFTARGCSILLNSVSQEGERYFNSALLVAPGQAVERYDKRHLVPFGEYVPLSRVFSFMASLARNAGDFSPAAELVLLDWSGEKLGPAICYEVVFPGEVAALTRAGATVLVSVTNDAWYGDTAAPWQHFAAARFRAAENRRWLLRAAITGVTAVVGPDGSLHGELGVGARGALSARFLGRTDLSPFVRAPWVVPSLCAALLLAALVAVRRDRPPI
ncbi:MAG: apolipoprotein N-acyltransferase [Thermoanaerobaculia bacterium]